MLLVITDGVADYEDLVLRCLQLEARCWLQCVFDHFQVDLVRRFHVHLLFHSMLVAPGTIGCAVATMRENEPMPTCGQPG